MTAYAADRADAAQTIRESGQPVTITPRAAGTYDPATGTATITAGTIAGYGVVFPLSPYRIASDSNIRVGDRQLLLAAETDGTVIDAPKVGDLVTLVNGTATLIAVDPLDPDGAAIIYDCIVRRAE